MGDSVKWSPKFSVGHETIDQQHKHLISLYNDCGQLIDNQDYEFQERFNKLLVNLIDYAQEHFKYEEKLMLACNYPNLDAHEKEHDEYISGLNKIVSDSLHGKIEINSLRYFLSKWLIDHILESDMKYKNYIKK